MLEYQLHPQISAATELVLKLPLCEVRLHRDANYPWLILVPQRANIREVHALAESEQMILMGEIAQVSSTLESLCSADKMNVAALGNMVPQLHIHVVARFRGDAAWPGPIWGAVPEIEYEARARQARIAELREALGTSARRDLAQKTVGRI